MVKTHIDQGNLMEKQVGQEEWPHIVTSHCGAGRSQQHAAITAAQPKLLLGAGLLEKTECNVLELLASEGFCSYVF